MKRRWRGIYSLHTKSNCYTQSAKLGGTESLNSIRPIQQIIYVTVRVFGGTKVQLGETDLVRVRA